MLLFSGVGHVGEYASPSGSVCLRCLTLTLSGPVELFLLFSRRLDLCYVGLSVFLSMCLICFVFDCVAELFVECVCYLCG